MADVFRVGGLSRGELTELVTDLEKAGGSVEVLDRAVEPRFSKSGEEFLVRANEAGVLGLLSRRGVNLGVSTVLAPSMGTYQLGGLDEKEMMAKIRSLQNESGTRGHIELVEGNQGRKFNVEFFDHEAMPDIEFTVRADGRALLELLSDKRVLVVRLD